MKITTLFSLSLVLFVCSGCPGEYPGKPDSEILSVNQSNQTIAVYMEGNRPTDTLLSTIGFPQTPENIAGRTINVGKVIKSGLLQFKEVLAEGEKLEHGNYLMGTLERLIMEKKIS